MFNKYLLSMIVLTGSILPVMASIPLESTQIRNYSQITDKDKYMLSEQDVKNSELLKNDSSNSGSFTKEEKSQKKYDENIIIKKNQDTVDNNYISKSIYTVDKEQKLKVDPLYTKKTLKTNVSVSSKTFKKDVTASYNKPVNRKYSFLGVINHKESTIDYDNDIIGKRHQNKISNNYITKGIYKTDKGREFKLTAKYSTNTARMLKEKIKNSDYTVKSGEYNIYGELKHKVKDYAVTTKIGFSLSNEKVKYDADNYFSWQKHGSKNWGSGAYSNEGGYGAWNTKKQTVTLKQDYSAPSFNKKGIKHELSFGWGLDIADAKFNRDKDTSLYYISENTYINDKSKISAISIKRSKRFNAKMAKLKRLRRANNLHKINKNNAKYSESSAFWKGRCIPNDPSCIVKEQFLTNKTVYKAKKINVKDNALSAYVQDKMTMGKLETTAGLRFDRTSLLKNNNIAPRLSSVYKYDNTTRIFGGINRYYSSNILSYVLNDNISANTRYARKFPTRWLTGVSSSLTDFKKLETPYSDELNLGMTKSVGNVEFTLQGVYRHGKKQFAKTKDANAKDVNNRYVVNNKGKSKGHTLSFKANGLKPIIVSEGILMSWNVETSHSKSTRNYNSLSNKIIPEIFRKKIIFNGKLINTNDMPALNSSRSIRSSANVNFYIPKYNLIFGNTIHYRSSYDGYTKKSFNCGSNEPACGNFTDPTYEYKKTKFDSDINLDLHLIYRPKDAKGLALTLDVINVFNKKQDDNFSIDSSNSEGRTIWSGIKYTW